MHLKNLQLFQFKNYPQASFSFSERIIGICGSNGVGKTNLLDAIYFLCFTKSYFGKADAQHVLNGAQGFRIAGQFETNDDSKTATCILRETGKKEFLLNGETYDKFSKHIGKFPCVFIAPDDVQIITGGSEERRHFMDTILCQLDPQYLQQLSTYNKVLQQRNSYLKSLPEKRLLDQQLMEVYNQQLLSSGNPVFEKRTLFLKELIPSVQVFYDKIAGHRESIAILYDSPLHTKPFDVLLKENIDKDIVLQRTTQGIHRDEIDIRLGDLPFKSIASQGQRKSLLFALKLAEFEILKHAKGFPPLLLLDDVFEKLDESRMDNLLQWVCVKNNGQVFITDTHQPRLENSLQALQQSCQILHLKS